MNKIIFALAALATVGFAATAEAKRDNNERAAFSQTVRSETLAPTTAPVLEGRNAAVAAPASTGVEPYISQSIEQDARGNK